jgi:hypothetical protein
MNDRRKGSVVVFGKDVNDAILPTIKKVYIGVSQNPDLDVEIILIDDGSSIPLTSSLPMDIRNKIITVRLEQSKGIGDAFIEGSLKACYDSVLFLPGHDFYSTSAVVRAMNLLGTCPVVIGYRSNLQQRPLIKRISSYTFRKVLKLRISKFVVDPHGLPIYPKRVVLKYLPRNARHALHIYILQALKDMNLETIQFSAPINPDYSEALLNGPRSYLAYMRNVWSVIRILFRPVRGING